MRPTIACSVGEHRVRIDQFQPRDAEYCCGVPHSISDDAPIRSLVSSGGPRFDSQDNPGAWLAHYTRADVAFDSILPSRELRMSPYSRMRDPYEQRVTPLSGSLSYADWDDYSSKLSAVAAAFEQARDGYELASFTTGPARADRPGEDPGTWGHLMPWARPRMWEQYGDRHRGVCLVFDRTSLTESLPVGRYRHGRVAYSTCGFETAEGAMFDQNGPPHRIHDEMKNHVKDYFEDFFMLKQEDWASEHEYRLVRLPVDDVQAPEAGSTRIHVGGALRAVVLGEQLPEWQVPAAKTVVEAIPGVELRQITWDLSRPTCEPLG